MIYFLFFFLILAVSCSHHYEDPLVEMSENVIKKDRGVDIEITPIDKQK